MSHTLNYVLRDPNDAADELDQLRAALQEIARQMLVPELIEEFGEEYAGDFEGAYEAIIRIARAAISSGDRGVK